MADSDLADLRKQCLASLLLCADNVSKYLDNDMSEYDKLNSCVKEYCLLDVQQEVAIQALEKAKTEVDASNIDTLDEKFESNLKNMAKKRFNADKHPYMVEFNKRIAKGMERVRSNNLDDSDLAITESQTTYNDPITKKAIEDPVRNSLCGHVYEKEVIMSIIQKKKMKCPVAGCGNREPIQQHHLKSDEELRFQMKITQHSTMIQERSVMELNDTQ